MARYALYQRCPVCDSTKWSEEQEFVDETGYVCDDCGSNVYYPDPTAR